ncbi:hypothetical protein [Nonomuraea typhae]|uniref:PE-PGRS family protein n=1 Tax=Nonomuraea typhae TaxID=2603600 RepID=A0ABW7ZC43_9ACTN
MSWWLAFWARCGNQAATRALWRRWRDGGDPRLWELLRRIGLRDDELVLAVILGGPVVRATALAAVIARGDQDVIDRLFHPDWGDQEGAIKLLRELTAAGLAPRAREHRAKVLLAIGDWGGYLEAGETATGSVPGLRWPHEIIAEHVIALDVQDSFIRGQLRRDDPFFAIFVRMLGRPLPPDLVDEALRSRHRLTVDLARERCRTARGEDLTALWAQATEPWPALLGNPARLSVEASRSAWRLWLAHPDADLTGHLLKHGSEVTDPALGDAIVAGKPEVLLEALISARTPEPIRALIQRSPALRGHAVHDLLTGRRGDLNMRQLITAYRNPRLREAIRTAVSTARDLDPLEIIDPDSREDRFFAADAFAAREEWPRLRDYLHTWPFLDLVEFGPHLAGHHPPELAPLRPALGLDPTMIHYARVTRSPRIKPILRRALPEMTGDDLAVVRWIQKSACDNPKLCRLARAVEECMTEKGPFP